MTLAAALALALAAAGPGVRTSLPAAPVKLFPISRFMRETVRIAHRYRRTFYDASYLALAIQESCALITADLRLLNALRDTPMRDHVRPLSEAMLR